MESCDINQFALCLIICPSIPNQRSHVEYGSNFAGKRDNLWNPNQYKCNGMWRRYDFIFDQL